MKKRQVNGCKKLMEEAVQLREVPLTHTKLNEGCNRTTNGFYPETFLKTSQATVLHQNPNQGVMDV